MKRTILAISMLFISSVLFAYECPEGNEVIEKIADNNVEIACVLYDENDIAIVIRKTNYGQKRIDREKRMTQANLENFQDEDWINEQIAKYEAELARLATIQEEMDE